MSWPAAVAIAGLIALAGGRLGWLTLGGVLVAWLVGGAVLEGAGFSGGALLGLFFVSGSLLTRWSERAGLVPTDAKGSRRDGIQVATNGVWAAIGALTIHAAPTLGWSILAGALGAAQADTWATEIGARAVTPPRLITSGVPVLAGTTGGVTPLGTAGGLLGAVLLGATAWAVAAPPPGGISALLGGCIGMLADSVLGATGQAVFNRNEAGADFTAPVHDVASSRTLIRGFAWCTNDVVNLAGTGAGAAVGLGLGWVWTLS
jgi:uncharacterized protein (TIGR00297 family)